MFEKEISLLFYAIFQHILNTEESETVDVVGYSNK